VELLQKLLQIIIISTGVVGIISAYNSWWALLWFFLFLRAFKLNFNILKEESIDKLIDLKERMKKPITPKSSPEPLVV